MPPLLLTVLSFVLLAFEFQNLLSWWRGRVVSPGEDESRDFTIVIPIYGDPKYFAGRDGLVQYRDNVLVALEVTPPKMQAFAEQLEAEGWHVHRIQMEKPNPALLLCEGLEQVTTTYALRLDADTILGDDLFRAMAAVEKSDADLCSVKVEVLNPRTVAEKIQALEYRMAMLGRHYRPWMTSGACLIGKTDALRLVYAHHSLWTPGEDIETGRTAHALRMRIRHCDIVVLTEAPATFRALFHQRRLWWAGTFRHQIINVDRNLLHLPVMTTYSLVVLWFSLWSRWWEAFDLKHLIVVFPLMLIGYAAASAVSHLQVLSRWMLVYPIYSFLQTLVMPVAGMLMYVQIARRYGRLGRYHFGYRRRSLPWPAPTPARRPQG